MPKRPTLGILHPGMMGAAVAAQARLNTDTVLWCPTGRSPATRKRADAAGLVPVTDMAELVYRSDVIISLCPPDRAVEVVSSVADLSFSGLYIEANAIAPERLGGMAASLARGNAGFVDAAVIGSPPTDARPTTLYVAGEGPATTAVTSLFSDTSVTVRMLSGEVGKASALKLAFTSYQKAARTLAAVAHALAAGHGVGDELMAVAKEHRTNYLEAIDYLPKVANRSWRWGPEMQEVAAALTASRLPAGLAEATAEVMRKWAACKDRDLTVDEVMRLLQQDEASPSGEQSARP